MDHAETKMMQDTVHFKVKAVKANDGIHDRGEEQTLFRKQKVLRFKFETDFITELTSFAKIHQFDQRNDYKEAWDKWCVENSEIVSREKMRLENLGYTGNVVDKMYKSSRYYFRTKSLAPVEPAKRRKYLSIGADMLDAIDNHIQTYLTSDIDTDKHTPAIGFADFAEKNQKLIEETVKMLSQKDAEKDAEKDHGGDVVIDKSANLITSDEASKKIKKTYKNRYFVAVRRKGM